MTMAYWLFKTNPKRYAIDRRLLDKEAKTTWRAKQHAKKMQIGDIAFAYRTGKSPGIVAVLKLSALPKVMAEIESEKPYDLGDDTGPERRVLCHFSERPSLIPKKKLDRLFLDQSRKRILDRQGTNFPLSDDEGDGILRLMETPQDPSA